MRRLAFSTGPVLIFGLKESGDRGAGPDDAGRDRGRDRGGEQVCRIRSRTDAAGAGVRASGVRSRSRADEAGTDSRRF